MAHSPASSDLSDPPSVDSDNEDQLSTAVPSSRHSVDMTNVDTDQLPPPSKRRKTGPSALATFERAPSSQPAEDEDNISISSDGFSSVPGSPNDDEYSLREQAQTQCLWRDCDFGTGMNNDDLVKHVQSTHCATGGPKKTKYTCEWGECQRKTSNHPSGYALKAHMRSHTKEKPYYCALPECDKSFTRSDALAKHMRTVHLPEPTKIAGPPESTPSGKKTVKLKLTNGNATSKPAAEKADQGPTHDEDGNEVDPSPPSDNITYMPAHHPVTGQPGFMIHYPPDINFTAWESSVSADQLMRLLRRQLHWAQKESEDVKKEIEMLEQQKREEWLLKEILLEGALEAELAQAEKEHLLDKVDAKVRAAMEADVAPARQYTWTDGPPKWRQSRPVATREVDDDVSMADAGESSEQQRSPSPRPVGVSGGFDGDGDPWDNFLQDRMAAYEERERLRNQKAAPDDNTPSKSQQQAAEADAEAAGTLLGLSGGKS